MLVIDGDDWVARLLADGLRDHGFTVRTCMSGAEALSVAATIEADCIISEMLLPELDGPSVVRAIRSGPPPLGAVPVVILTNSGELSSRNAAFQAGADVFITKPFRVADVALQVRALVAMSYRLTGSGQVLGQTDGDRLDRGHDRTDSGDHAIEGNIAQVSIATVLTLLEMERRSGTLSVTSRSGRCSIELVAGFVVGGTVNSIKNNPLAVLREILRWQEGRFQLFPGSDGAIPNNRWPIGALLIETVRLQDESTRDQGVEEMAISRPSWPAPPFEAKKPSMPPRAKPSRPPAGAPPTSRRAQPIPPPLPTSVRSAPRPEPGPSTTSHRARPIPPPLPTKWKP